MTAPVSLSVVIPAFNEEKRLPGTLAAILPFLRSRGETFEVIVVDDGSTDGTADAARKGGRRCGSCKAPEIAARAIRSAMEC